MTKREHGRTIGEEITEQEEKEAKSGLVAYVWYHPRSNEIEVFWIDPNETEPLKIAWLIACKCDGWVYIGEF